MTVEAHFDPEQTGTATVQGVEYEVWANKDTSCFAQLSRQQRGSRLVNDGVVSSDCGFRTRFVAALVQLASAAQPGVNASGR